MTSKSFRCMSGQMAHRWCVMPGHWKKGTHKDGGKGHVWSDVAVAVGSVLTFDDTAPNGAAIVALCIANRMTEV